MLPTTRSALLAGLCHLMSFNTIANGPPTSGTETGDPRSGPIVFHLHQESSTVRLLWSDALGTAGTRYEVQRSADAAVFTLIGVLQATDAAAAIEHSFVDLAPLPGVSYYRVCSFDRDGTERIGPVLPAVMEFRGEGLRAWPNPADDLVNVMFEPDRTPCHIRIADTTGQATLEVPLNGVSGTIGLGLGDLPAGTYLVTAWMDDGSQQQVRVVKR